MQGSLRAALPRTAWAGILRRASSSANAGLPRTRSLQEAPVTDPSSGMQRSVDAPADAAERVHRDTTGMSEKEAEAKARQTVDRAGARASEALSGRWVEVEVAVCRMRVSARSVCCAASQVLATCCCGCYSHACRASELSCNPSWHMNQTTPSQPSNARDSSAPPEATSPAAGKRVNWEETLVGNGITVSAGHGLVFFKAPPCVHARRHGRTCYGAHPPPTHTHT
jgi:hypothetical protein